MLSSLAMLGQRVAEQPSSSPLGVGKVALMLTMGIHLGGFVGLSDKVQWVNKPAAFTAPCSRDPRTISAPGPHQRNPAVEMALGSSRKGNKMLFLCQIRAGGVPGGPERAGSEGGSGTGESQPGARRALHEDVVRRILLGLTERCSARDSRAARW